MELNGTTTVAQLALENPATIDVFERHGIDFCCHGNVSIEQACNAAGVAYSKIVTDLEAIPVRDIAVHKWTDESMTAMIDHIVKTHHEYTKREIERFVRLAVKVRGVHGERHAELASVETLVKQAYDDLIPHMLKEEQILFPYVESMEEACTKGTPKPTPFFGTVRNPIAMMMQEHDAVGDLLVQLRKVTNGFAVPDDGCNSYRVLYEGLAAMENDLHIHIHLENNLLFPRAAQLEESFESGQPQFAVKQKACGCGH
jgi:iron-sulfur cluster repair di-iron protein